MNRSRSITQSAPPASELHAPPRRGSRHQPEETRARILAAALTEFATEGIAGARTESIAKAAGINKALLYYYFGSKESLYRAALDTVFAELSRRVLGVLESSLPPRERLLTYAGTHFDYLASRPLLPRLIQREVMRQAGMRQSEIPSLTQRYTRPVFQKIVQLLEEGMASGDFRSMPPMQTALSIAGTIIFYFISVEMIPPVVSADALSAESLAIRRAAVLDFIAAAIFTSQAPAPEGASA